MKKKIFILVMAFVIIFPAAFLLSACDDKKDPAKVTETGISVYIDGEEVNEQFNTIDINYGDYTDITELINNKLTVVVNYSDQTSSSLAYGDGGFAISSLPQNLNANEQGYKLTLTYKDFNKDLILVIHKANIDFTNVGWNYYEPYTYDGQEKTVSIVNLPKEVTVNYTGITSETNAGTYTAGVEFEYDKNNYNIINDEHLALTQQWTINKAQIDMWGVKWDYNSYEPFTYDGNEKEVQLTNLPAGVEVGYENNIATNARTYTATATLIYDTTNYELSNVNFDKTIEWTINKQQVNKPSKLSSRLFYSGQEQTGVNYNAQDKDVLFTVSGDLVATNAGEYSATFTLIDTNNYEWNDGTTTNVVIGWEIEKAPLYFSGTSWNYNSLEPFTYDGKEKTVAVINLPEGVTIKKYTGTTSAINAGTYKAGVEFNYDDENYYLSDKPQELQWKIEKAVNKITGELVIDGITYGETLGEPNGVSALYGEITYKYYNSEHTEISKPTNAGTYYVKGFSVEDNNWIAQETDYKQFFISRKYISDPELVRNSFIYTGTAFTPELVEEIDESIVEMSGDLSKLAIGNYTITFTLKDKTNYGWQNAFGTANETADITLEWRIIDNFLTLTLNKEALSASEIEELTQVDIGDKWQVTLNEDYNYSLDYEYLNESGNKVWSYNTDEGLYSELTVSPSHLTYVIEITQNAEVVYTKTITVNHDIFENVMVGDVAMTFDDFVANPEVEYNKNLTFNLKTEYENIFTFSQNNITITEDETITITYQLSGERVYKTIEVSCVIDPVESIQVGSQTLSYEQFIANPVVKYGDEITINFKPSYTGFYADHSFPYEVKDDIQVTIYTSTDEIFATIDVTCRANTLTNIKIDGEDVTYEDFLQMNSIHLGSSLTFTINEEFVNLIKVVDNNNGQDNVLTGQQTYTFNEVGSWQLNIREKDTQNYIDDIYLTVVLFDSIGINDNIFDISSSTSVGYDRDLGESTFEISFDSNLLDKYDLYYESNASMVEITQSSFEVSIDENEEYAHVTIYAHINDEYLQVLSINFASFCPVEMVSIDIYQPDQEGNLQYSINDNEVSLTSLGAISSLDITFKENYTGCTYKIFDESGDEIQDFTTIKNATYTIKIYSNNSEIYSFLFKVKYQFDNLIEGMQNLGENVALIVTNEDTLNVPTLTDTSFYTNQNITFNGTDDSVTLTEGQQTIEVVYTFTANQKIYTYAFDLVAECVPQEESPIHYVTNITVSYTDIWGSQKTVGFDSTLQYSNTEYELSYMAFVDENDIKITTIDGCNVVSKEIKFSEDKTACWLEYVISVDGEDKTFRAYIKTTGTVSNNTNAQIIFSDAKTELDITDLIVDNSYTIEKVNVFGDLDIILEDENARIEYYFNDEIVDRNNFALNSIGTYTVKIFSSDNTATRSINIIVQDYENLMFEVFYGDERLYLEYSDAGLLGNMKMKYDELTGPYFIGYFGKADLTGTQVTISGNTAYEEMLYYQDKVTPITDLDNLVLNIMTDTDGTLTGIVGGKYVLVYAKVEDTDFAVYFIFEDRPPYPMTFIFDTDNDNELTENDTQISLKVDLDELDTGVIDLGDFFFGKSGPSIEVTREELGMAETATSVSVTVKWSQAFGDYSYYYFTSMPEGQDIPELIGPSEDNLTSTFTLNFVDDGSGQLVATIYVCSEGATQGNLMSVLVTFILVG